MKCDLCKKAGATVHITQNSGPGETVRVDLCEQCAREQGVHDRSGLRLANVMLAIGKKWRG